jgi:hypothetical protein
MKTSKFRVPAILILTSFCAFGCMDGIDSTTGTSGTDPSDPSTERAAAVLSGASTLEACTPACGGRQCGADPTCGVSCGTCGDKETCDTTTGQCKADCAPNCTGRSCGPDPVCGTSCGTCGDNQTCDDTSGQCNTVCVPNCSGRTCGLDPTCGTSCGTCGDDSECNANGQCVGKHAPIAVVTSIKVAACDANTGTSSVVLDGSKSSDQDGGSLQFAWTEGTKFLAATSVATISLEFGVHAIMLTVRDTSGLSGSATSPVTVAKSAPIFTSDLAAISITTCSTESPVSLPIPTALDRCAAGPVTVSGVVISKNGTQVSIPVVSGSVVLPVGTSVVRWSAKADGLTTTADQVVSVTESSGVRASRKLDIADGAHIVRSSGGYALVINSGTVSTSVGVEAQLGSILSVAPVTLRDRAQVFGSVTTASTLTKQNNISIRDTVKERASIVLPSVSSLPNSIPSSTTDIILQPDRRQSISAGTYRNVVVASRSTLQLAAGTYYLDSLDLEPQSTLALNGSGAVQIYVRSSIIFRGKISDPKNATGNVQLNYLGTNAVYLESPFFGMLAAPKASITLRSVSTPHVGSFFAQDILVDAHASVTVRPSGCQ